jgi:hypothetical protein
MEKERMRYMLLIYHDSSFTARTVKGDGAAWLEEMERRGVRKHGDRLRPAAEAKTVSMHDGTLLMRDGPFAEAKEEMAGYDVIECADFDEAIEIASKHAAAKFGTIEIRPVWQTRRLGADP